MNAMLDDRDLLRIDCYERLLVDTAAAYPFRTFDVLGADDLASASFCIVRHDVDMAPERAVALARIEHRLGVRATYMVLMTGAFYNPFESTVRDQLREIANLGHVIGLHFDAAWHDIQHENGLQAGLARERDALAGMLGLDTIEVFSFHNTTPFTMSCRQSQYSGMWNAYAAALQENVDYVSDSNGYWRFRSWATVLGERPERLQVLTHPEWWTQGDAAPAEKAAGFIVTRAQRVWSDYCHLLTSNQRSNRSAIAPALAALGGRHVAEYDQILLNWLSGNRPAALVLLRNLLARMPGAAPLVQRLERALAAPGDRADPPEEQLLFLDACERLGSADGRGG
jgi:hypothetical protein